jgi:cyanate lyase
MIITGRVCEAPMRTIIEPPARRELDQLAFAVCQQMAEKDAAFKAVEVRRGLADFLCVVAAIYAKHLSRDTESQQVDKESEQG